MPMVSNKPFIFSQEYFFRWLHEMLAEMPDVSELHPVPDAHVPVLGFKINGISIDLLYANLAHVVIPEVILLYITAVISILLLLQVILVY
jgi:poly(A) polymerase Pap1